MSDTTATAALAFSISEASSRFLFHLFSSPSGASYGSLKQLLHVFLKWQQPPM